jgi:hypothetical protein
MSDGSICAGISREMEKPMYAMPVDGSVMRILFRAMF